MSDMEPTTRHNIVFRLERLLENCRENYAGDLTSEDVEDEDFFLFDEWLDALRDKGDFFGTEGQCDPAGDQRG